MTIRNLSKMALVAAIYFVLTVVLADLSFREIQFRVSEALLILIFIDKRYALAILLGTFLANLSSPLGLIDWVVGTFATLLTCVLLYYCKKYKLLSLHWAPIINGIIVGLELNIIFGLPLWLTMAQVFIGEWVVVCVLGYILWMVISKRSELLKILELD